MTWAWMPLVTVCSRHTNVIMAWAWMHWSPYALENERYYGWGMDALVTVCSRKRTLLWFGHGCTGHGMLSKHKRSHGLGMDALVTVCSRNTNVIMVWAWMHWSLYALETRTLLWLGRGCSGKRRQLDMNDIMA